LCEVLIVEFTDHKQTKRQAERQAERQRETVLVLTSSRETEHITQVFIELD